MKSLSMLVDILDAGNLSEAARRLKMTRANVSYHLGQLERSVGAQLVRRTTRRVQPTELGLALYRHGCKLRDELAAAQESVEAINRLPQGRVRLSAPSGYASFVLTPWLLEFKRSYPDIILDVLFENTVDDLLREEVDLAIRILPLPPENLVAREMGQVSYLACASPGYVAAHSLPQHPGELATAPVITASVAGRSLRVSAYLNGQRDVVPLNPTLTSRNYPFLRDATLDGLGIGLLPDYMVGEDIATGRLVTTLDDWRLSIYGQNLYLLYMPNRHHPRALAMLIEFLMQKSGALQHPASSLSPESLPS